MDNLFVPDSKSITPKETLFREIKEEYITIAETKIVLKTSFTLIDRLDKVSFNRPYIIGLECLSDIKMSNEYENAKQIVNYISEFVCSSISVPEVIGIGRKELMKCSKQKWQKDVIFCEFAFNAFIKSGFVPVGEPNKFNISHAIVDFNLINKNKARQAEKYMSENDMLVYASNMVHNINPNVIVLDV